MSYVMLVVTATCLITATVAWFTSSAASYVKAMELQAGTPEVIKVAVEPGGEDVDALRKQGENPEAVIDMPVFTNVTESESPVLAPGTHGSITLYITAMKPEISSCKVYPSFFGSMENKEGLIYMESISSFDNPEEEKAIIEKLVQGHILFFENYDTETDTFSKQITLQKPVECELGWGDNTNTGIEEQVTFYWYWPYELEDVPSEIKTNNRELFFEPERDALNKYSDSRLYDYADTKIGSYVKNVKFHIEVSAGDE